MTDQSPSEPAGAPEPAGDTPAALEPDTAAASKSPAAAPPPPPPAIAAAMDSRTAETPVPAPPPVPGSPAPALQASDWRPEDEPSGPAAVAANRPEIAVGAAFAGGLTLALILKRLAR